MAAQQSGSVVLASPFKVGFYAGLGFFFASALMSVPTFFLVAVLGIGSIVAAVAGSSHPRETEQQKTAEDPQAASAEFTPDAQVAPATTARPTYHRKTHSYGDN